MFLTSVRSLLSFLAMFLSTKMSSQAKAAKSSEKGKRLSKDQILIGFNQLRQDQKNLIEKISDLEHQLNEHGLVIETLKTVSASRKCYRMIGGVLVERTVKEVLPAVMDNKEMLAKVVESLNQQMEEKGKEINEFKEKHDIQIRREPSISLPPTASGGEEPSSAGVLVGEKS